MILLVTGGREYADKAFAFKVLDKIHARRPVTSIIEGGAAGADRLARMWANERGVSVTTCEADWKTYGGHAGRVRNCSMLREERPDMVAAFKGGTGTRHMVSIAEAAGIPTLKSWLFQA